MDDQILANPCSSCNHIPPTPKYFKRRKRIICKKCRAQRSREQMLVKEYGLTFQAFNDLLLQQGRRCAICRTDKPGGRGSFCVDHCHKSGRIRGLLCNRCNIILAKMGDDLAGAQRFVNYLSTGLGHSLVNIDLKRSRKPTRLGYVIFTNSEGKRVPKGSPGATAVRKWTRTFYVWMGGKAVSLKTADESEAWDRLGKLLSRGTIVTTLP